MQDRSCATLRGLCAPEVLAQSHQEPGTARLWQKVRREPCGTGRRWHCAGVWGQPAPPGQQGPGEGATRGTRHIPAADGRGQRRAQRSRVGWTGHAGPGWKVMGQSREGTAVLPALGPDGISGMAPIQGRGKAVPSLHRDAAKVAPVPWQCCSWVTRPPSPAPGQCPLLLWALPPSWQPREKRSSGLVPQGTLPRVIPCLNPPCCSQHSSPAR